MAKPNLNSPQASNPTLPPPPQPEETISQPVNAAEFSGQSNTSSQADAPTHFDGLIEQAQATDAIAQAPAAPVMLGSDEFTKLFFAGFNVAHGISGLQSLKIPEGDSSATACAGALHETIMDIPSLHFLLMPQGKWIPRIMAIAAFTIPVGRGVADEMRERRKPAANLNFSEAKKAARSQSTDPDDPPAESLAALNNRP